MKPEENDLNAAREPRRVPTTSVGNPAGLRELTSADLLAGQHEVCIRHGEEIYRLRVTRNGKLILHK